MPGKPKPKTKTVAKKKGGWDTPAGKEFIHETWSYQKQALDRGDREAFIWFWTWFFDNIIGKSDRVKRARLSKEEYEDVRDDFIKTAGKAFDAKMESKSKSKAKPRRDG